MFCTKCGSQIKENSRFCTVCGAELQKTETVGKNSQDSLDTGYFVPAGNLNDFENEETVKQQREMQYSYGEDEEEYWNMSEQGNNQGVTQYNYPINNGIPIVKGIILTVITMVVLAFLWFYLQPVYQCDNCGKKTRVAFYDPFDKEIYYCEECAKDYFSIIPYQNYRVR